MKAIEIIQSGNPTDKGQLRLAEVERPFLKPGEVLIEVYAAGINRPDVLQRRGRYRPPFGASEIPGLEIAGVIVDGDLSNSHFKLGDKVCALVQGGGYAQYCAAPLLQCLPIPKGLSFIEAASLPETFFTVWSNVFDRANIQPGETLLVQGGTSGIGVTAIQMAKAFGNPVFATARNTEKCSACVELGATRAINYMFEDFVAIVKEETNGKGVDVILDIMGAEYLSREVDCLAEDGRLVVIAHLGGRKGTLDIGQVLYKRLTITGSTLRPRSVEFKGKIAKNLLEKVWPLIESQQIHPVVHRIFPLDRAMQAHELMESSNHIGKIVLQVKEG